MKMKLNKPEIAIVAITKNGIEIAKKLKDGFVDVNVDIIWYHLNFLMLIYL